MTINIEYHENTGKYYVVRNLIYQNFKTQQNGEIFNILMIILNCIFAQHHHVFIMVLTFFFPAY